MSMKLEVIVLPVSDIDRAKHFYEKLGFKLDIDYRGDDNFRVIQFTPPDSDCSIIIGEGVTLAQPGSVQGLHLIVEDIEAARADLIARDIAVGEIFHDKGGVFHRTSKETQLPGPDPAHKNKASFASFSDPDGNGWVFQEIKN
jgi:catechol 2,3-dioxygenase-like lactoylglutathione lyase family enzyme